MAIEKTNVARLLDKAKVQYELRAYEVDETDLSALHVAEQLNESVDRIFKTLVLKGDKISYFVCIVPAGSELNLKSAAKISENKNCEMIPMKDLLTVTGYLRGACSPFAMKKQFPTYIHESCNEFDKIYVSAGRRGVQLYISPNDIIKLTNATLGSIIE